MTPKEKAEELFDKYESYMRFEDKIVIKECALIAVDEVLNSLEENRYQNKLIMDLYEDVKNEINEL
jgi:hypothetical protein